MIMLKAKLQMKSATLQKDMESFTFPTEQKQMKDNKTMSDNINPTYYRKGIETTDYIVSHSMNYLEGNIIKYVTRYKDKGGIEDLKKAE